MSRACVIPLLLLLTACGSGTHEIPRIYEGDSLTVLCDDYVDGDNRAVSGIGSYHLLGMVSEWEAGEYHIMIGINDIQAGLEDRYIGNMDGVFKKLMGNDVYVTSILPANLPWINNQIVRDTNKALEVLVGKYGYTFEDRYSEFEHNGILNSLYTNDNIHLNSKGCEVFF